MQAVITLVFSRVGKRLDIMLAVGVLLILMIMMAPLPPMIMDMLLAINISIGLLILLTSIYVLKPVDFSVFPSVLLFTTLYRLALNVASTRLILLHGQNGPSAAGHVIEGFGQFVVGGNTVVGLILFLILVLINFVVITKGSTRIAEVAARFTLDAMPGKQMAIDADLNAGLLNDAQAKERREAIAREAEFYGSMDGASKFVRGDAVAGLIITAINLIGGLIIGVMQQGMNLSDAVNIYSILTVGDGLVAQIPSLVISTAAGIIITRAGGERTLSADISIQFSRNPRIYTIGAVALLLMSFMPGMPFVPFMLLASGLAAISWYLESTVEKEVADTESLAAVPEDVSKEPPSIENMITVDPIRLEVGYGLIDLVESGGEGGLLDRLQAVRKKVAEEIGYLLPPVHIKDNLKLGVGEYKILVRGAEVGRGDIRPHHLLALGGQVSGAPVEGEPTQEPSFGLPAVWIERKNQQQAEISGYTVVDPSTVIATHVTEILRQHAYEMLDRVQVQEILDALSKKYGKVVEEMQSAQVKPGLLQNVLQRLLREWVPIHDLLLIMETISDNPAEQDKIEELMAKVRLRLARNIVQPFLDDQGSLAVLTIDAQIEREMGERIVQYPDWSLPLEADRWQRFLVHLSQTIAKNDQDVAVILTAPSIRPVLADYLSKSMSRIAILSTAEIPPYITVKALDSVGLNDAN